MNTAPDSLFVRPAERRDLPAVAALFDAYRRFYEQPGDLALATAYLNQRFERGESVLLVGGRAASGLTGFCQLYPSFCSVLAAPIFTLYDLFVSPEARGTGLGRALMQAAEAHGREAGAARLDLSTAHDNHAAQALYTAMGWQRDQRFWVYSKSLTGP